MSSKVSALTEISIPSLEDLLYTVDDPSGTPLSRKVSAARITGLIAHAAPQVRLTTESGVPVSLSDRTAQGTLYMTPSSPQGDLLTTGFIRTFDGTRIRLQSVSEVSLSLAGITSGNVYDVFLKDSDLSLVLSAAWTDPLSTTPATRANALATVQDLVVLGSDHTYLWLGTIYASDDDVTEDSQQIRSVWNAHNQIPRYLFRKESAVTGTYSTDGYQIANANSSNFVACVCGAPGGSLLHLILTGIMSSTGSVLTQGSVAIGLNDTSNPYSLCHIGCSYAAVAGVSLFHRVNLLATLYIPTPLGFTVANWLESGNDNGTIVWDYTRASGTIDFVAGLGGWVLS